MKKPARIQWMIIVVVGLALLVLQMSSSYALTAGDPGGEALGEGPTLILRADYVEGGSQRKLLPPPYLLRSAAQTATIKVTYIGGWPAEAQAAFEYAVQIWENALSSPVEIAVEARWEDLNYISPYVLGGASAVNFYRNFSGAPKSNTWYPVALANKLNGDDLDSSRADIEATLNSSFSSWYFGTEGNPGFQQYDFVSVVLHEIGHGLGFSGSMTVSGGVGSWGMGTSSPVIYDRFAANGLGQALVEGFANNSPQLGAQLTGGDLYFYGSRAIAANGGEPPELYAPPAWETGSSFSHLDENTFDNESGNALMTPSLANGEVNHFPGAIALGILEDIGWGATFSLLPTTIPSTTPGPVQTAAPTTQKTPNLTPTVTSTPVPALNYFGYIPSILKSWTTGGP